MYVGVEMEFIILNEDGYRDGDYRNEIIDYINRNYNDKGIEATTEYYDFMLEILFMYPIVKDDDISNMINSVEDRYGVKISYQTQLLYEPSSYNGMHIHTMILPFIFKDDEKLIRNNLFYHERFIRSHHIWGGCKSESDYRSWQRNIKYTPLNINQKTGKPDTFEIRCFNLTSLYNDFKLIDAIYRAINNSVLDKEYIKLDYEYFSKIKEEMIR